MKILHIWDICDNSNYLTEKLLEQGHKSLVVTRKKSKNYSKKGLVLFYIKVISRCLTFRADIIHINSWDKGILFAKIFSRKSKILMHFHGSDVLGKTLPNRIKYADLIGFSTKNIFNEHWFCHKFKPKRLLPVLVPDWFVDMGGRIMGTTLELDQDNRIIPYYKMPALLSSYEFYRDKKRRDNITSSEVLSKTGMEALRCGTKVIVDTGETIHTESDLAFQLSTIDDYLELYEGMTN